MFCDHIRVCDRSHCLFISYVFHACINNCELSDYLSNVPNLWTNDSQLLHFIGIQGRSDGQGLKVTCIEKCTAILCLILYRYIYHSSMCVGYLKSEKDYLKSGDGDLKLENCFLMGNDYSKKRNPVKKHYSFSKTFPQF